MTQSDGARPGATGTGATGMQAVARLQRPMASLAKPGPLKGKGMVRGGEIYGDL